MANVLRKVKVYCLTNHNTQSKSRIKVIGRFSAHDTFQWDAKTQVTHMPLCATVNKFEHFANEEKSRPSRQALPVNTYDIRQHSLQVTLTKLSRDSSSFH